MYGSGINVASIKKRIHACDYLTVAQLFLQHNFLLERELSPDDIKPRLFGHWGTSDVSPQSSDSKNYGFQLRCVTSR